MKMATYWMVAFHLPQIGGRHLHPVHGGDATQAADGDLAGDDDEAGPSPGPAHLDESEQRARDQQLVGDGVEEPTEDGGDLPAARQDIRRASR